MARKRKQDPVEGLLKIVGILVVGCFVFWKFAPGALAGFLKALALPLAAVVVAAGIVLFLRKSELVPRSGKSGKFWGCSNYPRGCRSMLNWRSIDG